MTSIPKPNDISNPTMDLQMYETPFYHLRLNNMNAQGVLGYCRMCLAGNQAKSVYFVNAHCFNISKYDGDYLQVLHESDLLLNDGLGIKIAAKLINLELKENMNGTDFIPKLMALAAEDNKGVYLLGAKPGVAATASEKLQQAHEGLNIRGYSSGYFHADEEPNIIERINASKAEIIVVGMGVPLQEKWIAHNKGKFKYAKIMVAGGAIIDFSAGQVRRAPTFIRALGFEWLYRLALEPRRLFSRYCIGNWRFMQHIATEKFFSRG